MQLLMNLPHGQMIGAAVKPFESSNDYGWMQAEGMIYGIVVKVFTRAEGYYTSIAVDVLWTLVNGSQQVCRHDFGISLNSLEVVEEI